MSHQVKILVEDAELVLMEAAPSPGFAMLAVQLAMSGALARLQAEGRDDDFSAMMTGNLQPVRDWLREHNAHPQIVAAFGVAYSYFVYRGDLARARSRLAEFLATEAPEPLPKAEIERIGALGATFLYDCFEREKAKRAPR